MPCAMVLAANATWRISFQRHEEVPDMFAIMGVMMVLMVVVLLGSGHHPTMGGHGKEGRKEESVMDNRDKKPCPQCPVEQKTENGQGDGAPDEKK